MSFITIELLCAMYTLLYIVNTATSTSSTWKKQQQQYATYEEKSLYQKLNGENKKGKFK